MDFDGVVVGECKSCGAPRILPCFSQGVAVAESTCICHADTFERLCQYPSLDGGLDDLFAMLTERFVRAECAFNDKRPKALVRHLASVVTYSVRIAYKILEERNR